MKKQFVKISSEFGLDIMALNFAKVFDVPVVILPSKDNKEDFEKEAERIFINMSFYCRQLKKVLFEEKEKYESEAWDIIAEFKAGKLDDALWKQFANGKLQPCKMVDTSFDDLSGGEFNVLFAPQKFVSNVACGIMAEKEGLSTEVFAFLKNYPERLILGQHFHKESDLPQVEKLAQEFLLYVPGMNDKEHVLGIRGVEHKELYDMYFWLDAAVGIAGTHTWLLLTLFPETAQIILYDKSGTENWKAIEAAYQAAGYCIHCIGFDAKTNMKELSAEIEEIYKTFFP